MQYPGELLNINVEATVNFIDAVLGTIASGSDDHLVLIWKIDLASIENEQVSEEVVTPTMELRGHSNFIRALAWSHEMQSLILSGSWDSSIRLWNIASGECLHVITGIYGGISIGNFIILSRKIVGPFIRSFIRSPFSCLFPLLFHPFPKVIRSRSVVHFLFILPILDFVSSWFLSSFLVDHSADVYSIASHPNRPFTFMSCSRDTTGEVNQTTVHLFFGISIL